jgi:glycosyltransferase involved in cell wall biosynthesis
MVPLALILKIIGKKVKVIYDMHENYPEALKHFQKRGIQKLIKNYKVAGIIDQICIKLSDKIIVVVDENKERLISQGISEEKIHIVSNVADIYYFDRFNQDGFNNENYKDRFLMLYTGTVSPERGLDTPVRAISLIKEKIKNIYLLIIGDGNSVTSLTELVKVLSIEDHVELKNWVGHQNLKKYILEADVCIIPQPFNDYINTTIPHKLFEYMSFARPVLVSDAKPLKRIVEETCAGLVFISNNVQSFAEQLFKLYNNSGSYGENGQTAIKNKYNWEFEEKKLFKVYESLDI